MAFKKGNPGRPKGAKNKVKKQPPTIVETPTVVIQRGTIKATDAAIAIVETNTSKALQYFVDVMNDEKAEVSHRLSAAREVANRGYPVASAIERRLQNLIEDLGDRIAELEAEIVPDATFTTNGGMNGSHPSA